MKKSDKTVVVAGLVAGIAGLMAMVGFVVEGNLRQTEIFYPESVVQHVSFQKVDGELAVVATQGTEGVNPTLISRTGFWYMLTVTNEDDVPHQFYVDGVEMQTRLLFPGESERVVFMPESEGSFNYYDRTGKMVPLGQIKIVTV